MSDTTGVATTGATVSTARSPADVLRLAVGVVLVVVLLVVTWLFGDGLVEFSSKLLRGLDAVPSWIVDTAVAGLRIIAIVTLIAGVAVTAVRAGWRMIATVVVAALVAAGLVMLLADWPSVAEGTAPVVVRDGLGPLSEEGFPTEAGLGAIAALVSAAAPWLSRTWRRWGWVAVVGLVAVRFVAVPLSVDSVKAALIGWTVGSAALVVFGAPSRRPSGDSIKAGLARSGLELESLKPASVDARGSTPYFGTAPDGSHYFVKALGDDQRSADLLFRAYRWVDRSQLGDERPFSSLRRAVEHEAFVALAARDIGVLTPRVSSVAAAEPNAFVLAYEAVDGSSLDGVPAEDLTDEVLGQVWTQLAALRRVRIAHRDLRLANVFLGSDGRIWMIDFGFSEIAASDKLLANDVAELVASSSTVVGPARAVSHAVESVDPELLAAAHDRLQPKLLSGASRAALKERPGLLEELRAGLSPG